LYHKKKFLGDDTLYQLILLIIIFSMFLFSITLAEAEETTSWTPTFIHSKIATTMGGWHSTTRGTIRLVFPYEGKWLVFRGDPNTYHFSADGLTWTATEAPQASRSHLIDGNTIYTFYTVLIEPEPKWIFDQFICQGTISGTKIKWQEPYKIDTQLGYYLDLKQDTNGYFTMTGRAALRDDKNNFIGTEVLWKRSKRPDDISEWGADVRYINHRSDKPIEGDRDSWKKIGSTVHENLTLEDGKSYAFAMMTVDGVGKLYGNLFDGEKWNTKETELATRMSTWAGTDRRMCAVFDKSAKIIHLAYVDGVGNLWYRNAKTPYGENDWSEPVRLQSYKTFTVVLSLDTSHQPNHVYALFGKTMFEDQKDLRNTYGELYLQRFDGKSWGEPVLVSEPGTEDNWYPNMNADLRHGIGILYLKGSSRTRQGKKPPLDIMFASTGPPKIASASAPVDVFAAGEGGHLTTRAHNRHLIYHAAAKTWYAFVGTSNALVKDAAGANALFSSTDGESWKLEDLFCQGYGTSSSQDAFLSGEKIYLLHWPNDWQKWDERYGGTPGEYPVEYQVRTYELSGGTEPHHDQDRQLSYHDDTAIRCTNHRLHFYGSMARGTDGYFWIGSRFAAKSDEGYTAAYITRNTRANDTSIWEEPVEIGRRRGNSVAPDLSALDNGYVISINHYSPFSAEEGKAIIAASVYNPKIENWSPETVVAIGNATHRLRGVAEFDPGSRRLHLLYPNERGDIRHKILSSPYASGNWSPEAGEDIPGELVVAGTDDDLTIALDYSRNPSPITLVYRKKGMVYRKDYNGEKWLNNDTPLVKVPEHSAELSLNIDASDKLGLLFLDTELERGRVIKFLQLPRFQKESKVSKSQEKPGFKQKLPGVTDVIVDDENCRGAHVTTRPHNRKVVYHASSKTWFTFYGTGHWIDKLGDAGLEKEMIAWRSSNDGNTFSKLSPAVVGNGHSSSTDILLAGDRIFLTGTRWGYWRQKAGIPWQKDGKAYYHRSTPSQRMFFVPYEVFPFDIVDGQLLVGQEAAALPGDAHVGHAGPHYGSITRDTNGHLWVAARAQSPEHGYLATWVAHTVRPDDITAWEPQHVLFKSSGPGTHAPQIIALDEGRVACVLFVKHEQMTSVYLYDPNSRTWGEPQIIGKGYQSKRASAVFDPGSRRLHVVYTDAVGDARHRALTAPYSLEDWSPPLNEPGILVAEKAGANRGDDDLSLSVNLSQNLAPLALVHRGPDLHLHLRYYDGENWSQKDVKVGLQDEAMTCDEASAVVDFSHGLGFVYWCQWKNKKVREEKNGIGQLRFCLVKDINALFTNE